MRLGERLGAAEGFVLGEDDGLLNGEFVGESCGMNGVGIFVGESDG